MTRLLRGKPLRQGDKVLYRPALLGPTGADL